MNWTINTGDALAVLSTMPDESVNCIVTSPPYWGLRDYGHDGQYGLERTPEEYTARMVGVFREARRVLRGDGTCWLNLGDSFASGKGTCYNPGGGDSSLGKKRKKQGAHPLDRGNKSTLSASGLKPKDLVGIPWRVAFALQADGWYLRQDIVWHKPNPMPESVKDRCTKSHEYMFLLTKSERYWYDAKAIEEAAVYSGPPRRKDSFARNVPVPPGQKPQHRESREDIPYTKTRNRRSVWTIPTTPFNGWTQICRLVRAEQDAFSDDMMHIALPNCPYHGGLFDLLTKVSCGGHADDFEIHIEHNGNCREKEHLFCFEQTEKRHAWSFLGKTLDFFPQDNFETAIQHNTKNRKMDRALLTNLSCMPSAERSSRIGDILEKLGLSEQDRDMLLSNTLPDEMDDHLLAKIPYRNVDKSSFIRPFDCVCGLYHKETKKTSHFATFPPKLIEPCILAGCPRGGVVLDPFIGSGTTGVVCVLHDRNCIGIELNPANVAMANERIARTAAMGVQEIMEGVV